MQPAVLIRLRPAGPWRYGPGDGGLDRVDAQYRSDRLYSALTLAMKQLGWLDEWLDATARSATPPVAFTSLFPYQGTTLFVIPPATFWPPPAALLTTPSPVFLSKIRWNVAQFVPVSLVETMLLGQTVLADQWLPDPESGCLLRRDRLNTTPFRTVLRTGVAVDRLNASTASVHTSACVEFEPGAGLWTIARYRDEAARSDWGQRLAAAFRLLADGGFGGKRSSGWGQTDAPEFEEGAWPSLLLPKLARARAREIARTGNAQADAESAAPPLHWLLSLFAPAESDKVDWAAGEYRVVVRGGYVEGASENKKRLRMIAEGSVLTSADDLVGTAVDVAPEAFPHPVYRYGVAVSLRLPMFTPMAPEVVETELDQILSELEVAAAQEFAQETSKIEQPFSEESGIDQTTDETLDEIVAEERSVELTQEPTREPEANPPGSPEFERQEQDTSEVEPQKGSEGLGSIEVESSVIGQIEVEQTPGSTANQSIEDPGAPRGEGPDDGI